MSVYSVTCFSVVRLVVRARFTLGEHKNILHFARRYSGVSARGCRGRSRHYLAQLVIHYQSSNNIHFLEQRNVRKLTNMPCGIFKKAMASLYHEIACSFSIARNCLSPHTLPSTALPEVPSWLLLPKTHAKCLFPKTVVGSLPRLPLLVIPPQTHTGCLYHNTHTGTPCHHPHSGCPFKKTYPCFRHSILAFSAQSSRTDRRLWTARAVSSGKKNRNLKFYKSET